MVERHVLALLRRRDGDALDEPGVSVDRIADGTGMSCHRAGVVVEGLEERGMLSVTPGEPPLLTLTNGGRIALERAGSWPPRRP